MWSPISIEDLRDLVRQSETEMSPAELRLWRFIGLPPEKWALPPWGDDGGGFWVVGLIGQHVVWYNDIEDGFNISRYIERGRIADYLCNQGSLQPVLWDVLRSIESGTALAAFGPPQPLDDNA